MSECVRVCVCVCGRGVVNHAARASPPPPHDPPLARARLCGTRRTRCTGTPCCCEVSWGESVDAAHWRGPAPRLPRWKTHLWRSAAFCVCVCVWECGRSARADPVGGHRGSGRGAAWVLQQQRHWSLQQLRVWVPGRSAACLHGGGRFPWGRRGWQPGVGGGGGVPPARRVAPGGEGVFYTGG